MLKLTPVSTDKNYSFSFYEADSDYLVVCFSGVGKKRYKMPPYEFVGAATNGGKHSTLFVSDFTRSWMSAPGLQDEIIDQLENSITKLAPKKVIAMGNSMGGFMALSLSRVMPIDVTIAFSPQFSADKNDVPEETRWTYHRNKIENFYVQRIENLPTDFGTHFVFHGGEHREYIHWSRFPTQDNLRHFIFPKGNHNIALALKEHNILDKVVTNCMDQRPRRVRQLTKQLGGCWRNTAAEEQCKTLW